MIGHQHNEGKPETERKDQTSAGDVTGYSIGEGRKWGHRGTVTRPRLQRH